MAQSQLQALWDELALISPELFQKLKPEIATVEALQEVIADDELILEYLTSENEAWVWIVDKENEWIVPLGPGEIIQNKASHFSQLMQNYELDSKATGMRDSLLNLSHSLHQLLLGPIEEVTDLTKKQIIIIPDQSLLFVPFEALIGTYNRNAPWKEQDYLIKHNLVSYVPSASALMAIRNRNAIPQSYEVELAAWGDAQYQTEKADYDYREDIDRIMSRSGKFKQLIYSRKELRGIERMFPEDKVYMKLASEASEDNFKQFFNGNSEEGKARFVHLALHGFFEDKYPDLGGVVFSKTKEHDGIVGMFDFLELKIDAELVVLSACETLKGKRIFGEGAFGMLQALLFGGTPSVILSKWKVMDIQTADFFIFFYQQLTENPEKGFADALRKAQLHQIQKGGQDSHPYFWAPFGLHGEPERLKP